MGSRKTLAECPELLLICLHVGVVIMGKKRMLTIKCRLCMSKYRRYAEIHVKPTKAKNS